MKRTPKTDFNPVHLRLKTAMNSLKSLEMQRTQAELALLEAELYDDSRKMAFYQSRVSEIDRFADIASALINSFEKELNHHE